MLEFYRAIWRATWRRQIVLIVLSLAVAALAAAPLKFQQEIINHMVAGGVWTTLVWLCAGFLGVVVLSGLLKFANNYLVSRSGELAVRYIRDRLYTRAVDGNTAAPIPRGTLVTILAAESEGVGTFAGTAIATPVMQLGTLASVVSFMAASSWILGAIALGVVLPQMIIVLVMQPRINREVKRRTQRLRRASDQISMSDLSQVEQQVVDDFDEVMRIRFRIFRLKLSVKLLQSVLSACGMAAVLLIGGWYVIEGRTDTGTVVAALAGLARIEGPWRELVAFYRLASTMRVSYELIVRAVTSDPPAATNFERP
jgi:ABC-type bacteriocin/lantibiotic exporter with double-glycine peptidase domain